MALQPQLPPPPLEPLCLPSDHTVPCLLSPTPIPWVALPSPRLLWPSFFLNHSTNHPILDVLFNRCAFHLVTRILDRVLKSRSDFVHPAQKRSVAPHCLWGKAQTPWPISPDHPSCLISWPPTFITLDFPCDSFKTSSSLQRCSLIPLLSRLDLETPF